MSRIGMRPIKPCDSLHHLTSSMRTPSKKVALLASAALLTTAAGYAYWASSREELPNFKTAEVRRTEVRATIGATGTLEPEEVVDVGAQVAGQILEFGKDTAGARIDYGSLVAEGAVLATIDESVYKAEVDSTAASLAQAKAARESALAAVLQSKARLVPAKREWDRAQVTGPAGAISASTFDSLRSAFEVAAAEVSVAEASVKRAEADIVRSEAALDRAKRNLAFCIIKSPVSGVIIDRRVNIGQTVVASLNAPSLFLIAKDLRRMQVWVPVNEVDIGRIKPGMPVTFTVDTFPGRKFSGKVGKIRLNASMTNNVVTYVVEVNTDNADGTLLPYLSASVRFETGRSPDTLAVPSAALAWTPDDAPEVTDPSAKPDLWLLRDGKPVRVEVEAGLNDGSMTAVSGADLREGDLVIVGESKSKGSEGGTTNPFAPPIRRRPPAANPSLSGR